MGRVRDCGGNRHATKRSRKVLSTATRGGGWVAKVGRRPGVRLKWPRSRRSDKIYTLSPQSINIVISIRGHGGIRTHNENFCYKVINYAVRIVNYTAKVIPTRWRRWLQFFGIKNKSPFLRSVLFSTPQLWRNKLIVLSVPRCFWSRGCKSRISE